MQRKQARHASAKLGIRVAGAGTEMIPRRLYHIYRFAP